MAQQVITTLVDDLDGSEAAQTIVFGLDGRSYEIDLNDKNAAKLRKELEKYAAVGRKVGAKASAGSRGRASSAAKGSGEDTAAIRQWAKENGLEVNDRGRVPASIREAYAAANA